MIDPATFHRCPTRASSCSMTARHARPLCRVPRSALGDRGDAVDRGHARAARVRMRPPPGDHQSRRSGAAKHDCSTSSAEPATTRWPPWTPPSPRSSGHSAATIRRPWSSTKPTRIFGSKKAAENNEDLRKLLNAGHQRGKPALRCVGPLQIPTQFNVFAMAALAGIGTMPDTITDRAVNIAMRRRAPGEKVSQFRSRRDGPKLAALRDRLAAWAAAHLDDLPRPRRGCRSRTAPPTPGSR